MNNTKEIISLDDIKKLVDTFYEKVRKDELIGPIFNERIQDRMEKMYNFWQTVLLGDRTYSGSPFPPYSNLPVSNQHFETWLKLFTKTVDELFVGERANDAKWRAGKMAEMFEYKIEYYKNRPL